MRTGIIGFGLMGQARARSLAGIPGASFTAVFDPDPARVASAVNDSGCEAEASYQSLVHREDLDAVIIAVPHFLTAEVASAALKAGKHVLCEKPLGRTVAECRMILEALRPGQKLVPGFNYRFYPGIQRAKELLRSGAIGDLRHLRFVLGHGGRPGYEKEWKTSRELCGGGALLDPGIHVIDLIRFLAGEIESGSADLFRAFWDIDVEDNVFATLRLAQGRFAQIHVSITEWKSLFALDLIGTDGMIEVRGRSGFYGPQQIRVTRRWAWLQDPAGNIPDEQFPPEDRSFAEELRAFFAWIAGSGPGDLGTPADGRRAIEVVESLYGERSALAAHSN